MNRAQNWIKVLKKKFPYAEVSVNEFGQYDVRYGDEYEETVDTYYDDGVLKLAGSTISEV